MSDALCVGVCLIDPDTGACMGCGRLPEEISGVPQPAAPTRENAGKAPPLPPQVAAEAAKLSDG